MTEDQATVKAPTTVRPPIVAPTEADAAGLTEAEATRRLVQYGENALVEHHVSVFERLAHYLLGTDPVDDRSRGGDAEKYLGSPKDKIEKKLVPGGHIGLFMGLRTLKEAWPTIAQWITVRT